MLPVLQAWVAMTRSRASGIIRDRGLADAIAAAVTVGLLIFVIYEGLHQTQSSPPPRPSDPPANIAPVPDFLSACYPHNMEET